MVEYAPTAQIFENPKEQYTKDYLMRRVQLMVWL